MDGLDAQDFIEIKIATRIKPGFLHSEEYLEKKKSRKAASAYRLGLHGGKARSRGINALADELIFSCFWFKMNSSQWLNCLESQSRLSTSLCVCKEQLPHVSRGAEGRVSVFSFNTVVVLLLSIVTLFLSW